MTLPKEIDGKSRSPTAASAPNLQNIKDNKTDKMEQVRLFYM